MKPLYEPARTSREGYLVFQALALLMFVKGSFPRRRLEHIATNHEGTLPPTHPSDPPRRALAGGTLRTAPPRTVLPPGIVLKGAMHVLKFILRLLVPQ